MKHDLLITHKDYRSHGFFSCCTLRLNLITQFAHDYAKFPVILDFPEQFFLYKEDPKQNIVSFFFKDPNLTIEDGQNLTNIRVYHTWMQHSSFIKFLPVEAMFPFIERYFQPSNIVNEIVKDFENEHKIDYSNTAAIYYRGTDKHIEANHITKETLGSYETFISKAEEILINNPNIRFFVQTDETEFRDAFIKRFPNNSFFNQNLITTFRNNTTGVHFLCPPSERSIQGARFFAMVLVMSKCKFLVIPTSNSSLWSILCRGNLNGVHQLYKNEWHTK